MGKLALSLLSFITWLWPIQEKIETVHNRRIEEKEIRAPGTKNFFILDYLSL